MTAPDEPQAATERELLTDAARALRSFTIRALTVKPSLDAPYRDDPRWTPWTRWVEPEARRAHDLARRIRKHLAGYGIRVNGPGGAVPGLWPDIDDATKAVAAERARLSALVTRWRKAAESLASSNAAWSSHFYDSANELDAVIWGEAPEDGS